MGADPMDLARKLAETYKTIKFGRGVVGKTSHATLALLGAWGIILFRLSENIILDSVLLFGGLIVTSVYCWWVHRTHKFAEANPGLAMLEGAQFVEYQKWEHEVKGHTPLPPSTPLIRDTYKPPIRQDKDDRQ
jgi:hypothetical protein